MKTFICCITFLFLLMGTSFGYTSGASYTWNASTPNYNALATVYPGTIDTSPWVMGDFLGRSATNPNAKGYGDSGTTVNWDDTWKGNVGNANTNGDALDGLWVQIRSDGGWWDLGFKASEVAVFSSQDHSPYLGEGLEYRVFGTNTLWDNNNLSNQARIAEVYLDGWRPHNCSEDKNRNGWLSDDISAVFKLDGSYRYIKIVSWTQTGGYCEPEIDAVGAIPEPATLLLVGPGLFGLAVIARRKLKKNNSVLA